MNAKTRIGTDHTQPESVAFFRRYAAKIEAIAALDRGYFATKSPSLAERAAYYERQAVLERTRLRLYAEFIDALRGLLSGYDQWCFQPFPTSF
jgi:hypothetical protein